MSSDEAQVGGGETATRLPLETVWVPDGPRRRLEQWALDLFAAIPTRSKARKMAKREELLAATREGEIISVDPVLGTRVVAGDVGELAVLHIHEDRKHLLGVSRDGKWFVQTLRGELQIEGRHEFMGRMQGFLTGNYVVMAGDLGTSRQLLIYDREGNRKGRVSLPEKVAVTVSPKGRLALS